MDRTQKMETENMSKLIMGMSWPLMVSLLVQSLYNIVDSIFVATMYQRFLQATGDTVSSMISLIAGAVTNIILDPIFIFGLLGFPRMEVLGAAIATVIGQWVSAAAAPTCCFCSACLSVCKILGRGHSVVRHVDI